jgi:hypothetical protein
MPPLAPEHLVTVVPPGLPICLGIDMGPAFAYVTASMIEGWARTTADVVAQALGNLHDLAAEVSPAEVIHGPIDDVETGWLQTGSGIGSTLILAPQELARIFGTAPRLFVAPMRDLIIGLPPGENELAAWLFGEIAVQDPNHLQPWSYRFDGEAVRVERLANGTALSI